MSFSSMVGQKEAKLALILNCIDPLIGGVLLAGEKGTGKSTLARSLKALIPEDIPFIEVPLNVTEDSLLDSVSIDDAIRTGGKVTQPGLLSRASGGILYVDDVNLMNRDLLKIIFDHQDRSAGDGERRQKERSIAGNFSIVASMNPEEGPLPSTVADRFGLCSSLTSCTGREDRRRLLRRTLPEDKNAKSPDKGLSRLSARIALAGQSIKNLGVSEVIRSKIVRTCIDANIAGHRGDIVLQRAAVAYAALRGDLTVTEKHLEKVIPPALVHRARELRQLNDDEMNNPESTEPDAADSQRGERNPSGNDNDPGGIREGSGAESGGGESDSAAPLSREGGSREETFAAGDPFGVRRIALRKDRIERKTAGRRTGTKFSGKGGRYVKSILRKRKNDIAVDATLRAAAPWQQSRGRTANVIIHEEDLRYRQRERKMRHLVVFVLDCSGSMGAKKRMVETKAAVLSLLIDCYHKRDKVALIAFRKDRAELVLPPTSSVETASGRLSVLPVGGKTPLTAGLHAAYNLIRQVRVKDPHTRSLVVLISDGRANQPLGEMPVGKEIARCARALSQLPGTDTIVVDTEDKSSFVRSDSALALSGMLGAEYFTTNDLKAEYLAGIVSSGKERIK